MVDEIVLLRLDDTHGTLIDLPLSAADVVLAGAALMDLALRNRIDSDLERLILVDPGPTDDDILDDVLTRLAAAQDELTTAGAIELITRNARQYHEKAIRHLLDKGILHEQGGRFLWVFRGRRYPVVDDTEQREVRTRLRQILLTDELPEPRDVVLICLIDACNLLGLVLTADEITESKPRVERLGRLDLIGQAVTKAVGEIRFIVRHAASSGY
jgi:hypothetical protein